MEGCALGLFCIARGFLCLAVLLNKESPEKAQIKLGYACWANLATDSALLLSSLGLSLSLWLYVYISVYEHMFICMWMHMCTCVWRSENNLRYCDPQIVTGQRPLNKTRVPIWESLQSKNQLAGAFRPQVPGTKLDKFLSDIPMGGGVSGMVVGGGSPLSQPWMAAAGTRRRNLGDLVTFSTGS